VPPRSPPQTLSLTSFQLERLIDQRALRRLQPATTANNGALASSTGAQAHEDGAWRAERYNANRNETHEQLGACFLFVRSNASAIERT